MVLHRGTLAVAMTKGRRVGVPSSLWRRLSCAVVAVVAVARCDPRLAVARSDGPYFGARGMNKVRSRRYSTEAALAAGPVTIKEHRARLHAIEHRHDIPDVHRHQLARARQASRPDRPRHQSARRRPPRSPGCD